MFYKDKYSWVQPVFNCIEAMYKLKKDENIVLSRKQLIHKYNEVSSVGIVGLTSWVLLQAQSIGFCEESEYRDFGNDDVKFKI